MKLPFHQLAIIPQKKYVVEGIMEGQNGRVSNVRSVWFVSEGEEIPHFVTAYPIRGVQ